MRTVTSVTFGQLAVTLLEPGHEVVDTRACDLGVKELLLAVFGQFFPAFLPDVEVDFTIVFVAIVVSSILKLVK